MSPASRPVARPSRGSADRPAAVTPRSSRTAGRSTVGLAVVVAAMVGAASMPASAGAACTVRWQPGLFGGPGSTVPVCESGPSGATKKPRPAAKKPRSKPKVPTRSQYRTLRFTPRATVSARVEDALVRRLAGAGSPDDVRQRLRDSRLLPQFSSATRSLGGSSRDIADVYASSLLIVWSTVRGTDRWNTKVARAVRTEIRRQFALDRGIRRASDAVKQERAEWLASWTVLLTAQWLTYRREGDSAAASAWQRRVRSEARQSDLLGVDVATLRLSSKGITRR